METRMAEAGNEAVREGEGEAEGSTPRKTVDAMMAEIILIVPDVDPEYLTKLLTDSTYCSQIDPVPAIMDELLSNPYPKVSRDKGKGKAVVGKRKRSDSPERVTGSSESELEAKYVRKEGRQACGYDYYCQATERLGIEFPKVPVAYLRQLLDEEKFYVPSFLHIERDYSLPRGQRKIKELQMGRKNKGKKVDRELPKELTEELAWFEEYRVRKETERMEEEEERLAEEEEDKKGLLIECGCCFGSFRFVKMMQCPEGHLFCKDCARRHAEERISNRRLDLPCMDGDGCIAQFSEAEMRKFCLPQTMELRAKLKQEKELELAQESGLSGIEKCPFCPFACIIENPEEKLLTCQDEECGRVSCRKCKKDNHLPMSCEEAAKDDKISRIHSVEEAMTEALIRECPKCKTKFVKEEGCNKMSCPNCRTMICYICRKVVTGYDHFANAGTNVQIQNPNATCALWDDARVVEHNQVEAARRAAQAELDPNDVDADALRRLELGATPQRRDAQAQAAARDAQLGIGAWGRHGMPIGLPLPRRDGIQAFMAGRGQVEADALRRRLEQERVNDEERLRVARLAQERLEVRAQRRADAVPFADAVDLWDWDRDEVLPAPAPAPRPRQRRRV